MSESGRNWDSLLKDGEKLIWQGRPTCTQVVEPVNKFLVYAEIGIGIIWIIASLVIYLPIANGIISFVIIDLVPFFLILLPILNARTVKNTYYAITDRRVIVDLGGQDYSMAYDENTEVKKTDHGSILVGAAVTAQPSKERHLLLFRGVMDSDKNTLGLVLYTVDDQEGAYKALTEKH